MSFLKTWNLIHKFKEHCKVKRWNTYENEDLIKGNNEYNKFVWINNLHTNTFKRIVLDQLWNLCAIREGVSYRMVRLSYMAWVLSETPYTSIWQVFEDSPILSRKVALYDLSTAYEGNRKCLKVNETKSVVLREFDRFLKKEYEIELIPFNGVKNTHAYWR